MQPNLELVISQFYAAGLEAVEGNLALPLALLPVKGFFGLVILGGS